MAVYTIFELHKKVQFKCSDDQYILDAAEEAGYDYPYSSRAGADSASAARMVIGPYPDQTDQSFLSNEEMAQGYFLMDVAYPRGDCVIEAYQEDNLKHGGGKYQDSSVPPKFNPFGGRTINM